MAVLALPFKLQMKKLVSLASKVTVIYSKVDSGCQLLAFNCVYHLVAYDISKVKGDSSKESKEKSQMFERCVKQMYMEFTKESKQGGGGQSVQSELRIA